MPTAQFIHDGNAIDHTPAPGSDLTAGDVVVIGDLIGIAKLDIPAGTLGALAVTGVFDVPKATGAATAITGGAKVYWHTGIQQANTTSSGGKYLGKTVADAGDDDATVRVRLEQ